MRAESVSEREVEIEIGPLGAVAGTLRLPPSPVGLVLFAHGSGSSRYSGRNRFVAAALNKSAIGTLLLDLLTPREAAVDERTAQLRFDIELLASRLVAATHFIRQQPAWPRSRSGTSAQVPVPRRRSSRPRGR